MSSFKNGLTKSWFTNSEYERVSTKLHALCLSLLTIIMLFFMANEKEYIDLAGGPKGFKSACLLVASISGMFYASLVSIDVVIRSKYPSFRYFDEFAICAAYVCLWSLFALMFKKYVLLSLIGVVVLVYWVGRSGIMLSKWRRAHGLHDKIKDTQRILIASLSESNTPAAVNAITIMALYSAINAPGEPTTKLLARNAMIMCGALSPASAPASAPASVPPSVPASPQPPPL